MDLRQIAEPSAEPVTLAEAKAHLRVDSDAEDALIAAWIVSARQMVESLTGRALMPQDWELRLDRFPTAGLCCSDLYYGGHQVRSIELPHAPLTSLTSFKMVAADGTETTLTTSDYQIEAPSGPTAQRATLYPPAGNIWPATDVGVRGAIRIRYRAGYASSDAVPAPLRAAMLLAIGDLFDNREQANGKNVTDNPAFARLLAPYKLWNV